MWQVTVCSHAQVELDAYAQRTRQISQQSACADMSYLQYLLKYMRAIMNLLIEYQVPRDWKRVRDSTVSVSTGCHETLKTTYHDIIQWCGTIFSSYARSMSRSDSDGLLHRCSNSRRSQSSWTSKWVWWSSTIRQAQTSGSQVSKTPTAELYGASQNRERPRIWDFVTQRNEVQNRQRCSQDRSLGHCSANEVILSWTLLWPYILEIVLERKVLLLSDRRVRFFSVSDTRTSTDRSLSCIKCVGNKEESGKRSSNNVRFWYEQRLVNPIKRRQEFKDLQFHHDNESNSSSADEYEVQMRDEKGTTWTKEIFFLFFVALESTSLHLLPTSYLWLKRYGIAIHHLDIQIWLEISVSFVTIPEFYSAQLWSWIVYIDIKKMKSCCFDHRHIIYIYIHIYIYI